MHLVTPKNRARYLDLLIAELLELHSAKTIEEQSRAILARMNRSYSHAIIDGTDYIIVPTTQSPREEKTAA